MKELCLLVEIKKELFAFAVVLLLTAVNTFQTCITVGKQAVEMARYIKK